MSDLPTGGCHCGAVRWQASAAPKLLLNCHCTMCRRLSGADYSSWVIIKDDGFALIEGERELAEYAASAGFSRRFCRHCGTTVTAVNDDKFPGHTYVARGTLDDGEGYSVNLQVFTQYKAEWSQLDDRYPVMANPNESA